MAAAAWVAFGSQPWELLPFATSASWDRCSTPSERAWATTTTSCCPSTRPGARRCTAVLAMAVFGFVAAIALLVAARQPLAAAAVTIAGAGWPATLLDDAAVAVGTLALAGALSIALVLRARSLRTLVGGARRRARGRRGRVGFLRHVLHARGRSRLAGMEHSRSRAAGARAFASSGSAIRRDRLPADERPSFSVAGADRAHYWRASTLDEFIADRWFEDPSSCSRGGREGGRSSTSSRPSRPATRHLARAARRVEGARGRPAGRGRHAGSVEAPSRERLHVRGRNDAREDASARRRYKVWSYVPDPAPRGPPACPGPVSAGGAAVLALGGRELPRFGAPNRARRVAAILADPSYSDLGAYKPLYERARRVAQGAKSPYAAVLALESWLRQTRRVRLRRATAGERPAPAGQLRDADARGTASTSPARWR